MKHVRFSLRTALILAALLLIVPGITVLAQEIISSAEPGYTAPAQALPEQIIGDDPDATDAAVRDGWLHTGDMVRVEANGALSFFDREKDMIKRSGENVAAVAREVLARLG